MNALKDNRRKIVVFGLIAIILLIITFPVVSVSDERIILFAPERLLNIFTGDDIFDYDSRIIGSHVIETEYGKINIRHFSAISFWRDGTRRSLWVGFDMFQRGLASHNLVIEGIKIPSNISVSLCADAGQIHRITLSSNVIREEQEINISTFPFRVSSISTILDRDRPPPQPRINPEHIIPDHPLLMDITMYNLRYMGNVEYFLLSDSTQIDFERFRGRLHINKYNNWWILESDNFANPSIFVKRPEDYEFKRYRTIIFKPDWGDFIEGEVFVEVPDIADFSATHRTTMMVRLAPSPFIFRTVATLEANTKVQVLETRVVNRWYGGELILYVRALSENGFYGWFRLDTRTSAWQPDSDITITISEI